MFRAAALFSALVALAASADDKPAPKGADPKPTFPGPTATGFLLPNGWHLTPVGKHLETTDLPLNIVPLKDGKHVLVATSGYNRHDLILADVSGAEPKEVDRQSARQSWYGLAVGKDGGKVWWSAGGWWRRCADRPPAASSAPTCTGSCATGGRSRNAA